MGRAHSPSFLSLHLRHRSFSNPSLALPTSQLILQPFRCFTYVTAHSLALLSLLVRHRIFTYITLRAAHGLYVDFFVLSVPVLFGAFVSEMSPSKTTKIELVLFPFQAMFLCLWEILYFYSGIVFSSHARLCRCH